MKGSIGTPMVIEHIPRKKGVHCKECKYLQYFGGNPPYRCTIRHEDRHYTSVCKCNKFENKVEKQEKKPTKPYRNR